MNPRAARTRGTWAAVVAAVGILILGTGVTAARTQQVLIGLLAPLTGNYATGGSSVAYGAELAVEEANRSGKYPYRFVLVKEDTQADQMRGLNAMNKLIDLDRVTAIIGPMLSGVALTAGPIAQDAGVPFVTPAASAPEVADIGDYQFRNMMTNDVQAAQMAEYAVRGLGLERGSRFCTPTTTTGSACAGCLKNRCGPRAAGWSRRKLTWTVTRTSAPR